MKILLNEQFSDFPLEEFPFDENHSAVGEYHHYMPNGYRGRFYDPVNNHQWRSMGGSWLVTEENGIRYMMQNRGHYSHGYFSDLVCILAVEDLKITNFEVETEITLLSTKNYSGLAFNYIHSQKYYGVRFDNNKVVLYYKDQTTVKTLMEIDYQIESLTPYNLEIKKTNVDITVSINNQKLFNYPLTTKDEFKQGTIALLSQNAAKYKHLVIKQTTDDYIDDNNLINEHKKNVLEKREKYAPIEVINKINLKGFGSARQLRIFKHEDKNYFIFAQHNKKIFRDAFASISCLTCFDDEGNLVWQIGTPNKNLDNSLISSDLPFQVSDMNGDGIPELIYVADFYIYICNALTGEVIKKEKTPYVKNDNKLANDYPYDYLEVDMVRVANFSGNNTQSDFIIKDRYHNVWAYDYNFKLLFRYNHKNTGHFPYIYDFDNDGRDEMFVGYDMVKDGKILWSLPYNSDHTDEIIWAPLNESESRVLLLASGNEGFNVISAEGSVIKQIPVGHAQRISLAKYDNNLPGYQIAVTSFWGSNGILYTFDSKLNLVSEREMVGNGNLITPINYDNSKSQLMLSNTDPKYGGLLDMNLDVVVKFPNDQHPTLASEAIDLDGDGITEILTWDQDQLWIYKTSKTVDDKIKTFESYPNNAFSNYRGEYLISKKR